jgi:hypothetical protein
MMLAILRITVDVRLAMATSTFGSISASLWLPRAVTWKELAAVRWSPT